MSQAAASALGVLFGELNMWCTSYALHCIFFSG